jgi:hypothetical protein
MRMGDQFITKIRVTEKTRLMLLDLPAQYLSVCVVKGNFDRIFIIGNASVRVKPVRIQYSVKITVSSTA